MHDDRPQVPSVMCTAVACAAFQDLAVGCDLLLAHARPSLMQVDLLSPCMHVQVVLLGCGMDTRPYRLGWPMGTVLFLLAPQEVHDAGEQALRAVGATVTRGCLLRRVPIDLQVSFPQWQHRWSAFASASESLHCVQPLKLDSADLLEEG